MKLKIFSSIVLIFVGFFAGAWFASERGLSYISINFNDFGEIAQLQIAKGDQTVFFSKKSSGTIEVLQVRSSDNGNFGLIDMGKLDFVYDENKSGYGYHFQNITSSNFRVLADESRFNGSRATGCKSILGGFSYRFSFDKEGLTKSIFISGKTF